jgi:hypothetical protein
VAAEALNALWMTWLLVVASRMPKLAVPLRLDRERQLR